MATIRNNLITEGFSGMLGNTVVFRQLRGKTIVANRPRPARGQSDQQRENRMRFRDATVFAKAAMYNPEKKAYYLKKARKLKLPNAYTAAITDYMRKPVVSKIDASRYQGCTGDRLIITAGKQDFALASVEVTVADAQGTPLASGTALPKNLRKNEWSLRMPVATPGATQFVVTAKDRAGNVSRLVYSNGESGMTSLD